MNLEKLEEAIQTWKENPTDDNAKAYFIIWAEIEENGRGGNAANAHWFYCVQPEALWNQLRDLGCTADHPGKRTGSPRTSGATKPSR